MNSSQTISLGLHAFDKGYRQAESRALELSAQMVSNTFDWSNQIDTEQAEAQARGTVEEWIEKFEQHYFSRRNRTDRTENTWHPEYRLVLDKLDPAAPLDELVLRACILSTEPDSLRQLQFFQTFEAYASFAGLGLVAANSDWKALRGTYNASQVNPQDLPDDKQVQAVQEIIRNQSKEWAWVCGMMAAFGLRPSEPWILADTSDLLSGGYMVEVSDKSKTETPRRVWAVYPEWVERSELRDIMLPVRNIKRDTGQRRGSYTTPKPNTLGMPWPTYAPRHARAVRDIVCGLDVSLSAAQMGHGVDVHYKTYQRWISRDVHQRAFEILMDRPDRPWPPAQ